MIESLNTVIEAPEFKEALTALSAICIGLGFLGWTGSYEDGRNYLIYLCLMTLGVCLLYIAQVLL